MFIGIVHDINTSDCGGPDWGSIGHDQILKNHKAHEADNEFERPPLASASHILRMKIFGATLEKINIEPRNLNPLEEEKKHIYTPPWFELTILSSVLKPLGFVETHKSTHTWYHHTVVLKPSCSTKIVANF